MTKYLTGITVNNVLTYIYYNTKHIKADKQYNINSKYIYNDNNRLDIVTLIGQLDNLTVKRIYKQQFKYNPLLFYSDRKSDYIVIPYNEVIQKVMTETEFKVYTSNMLQNVNN